MFLYAEKQILLRQRCRRAGPLLRQCAAPLRADSYR